MQDSKWGRYFLKQARTKLQPTLALHVSCNWFGSRVGICVCLFVYPECINNHWHDMVWYKLCDWLTSFTAFPCFQLLYVSSVVNKMDGCGLINTTCHECLPAKEDDNMVLAIEGLPSIYDYSHYGANTCCCCCRFVAATTYAICVHG